MPAEVAGQHPLLERAASGDREAFAQLYDTQVDGIYRYLLAWTADPAQASKLTAEVFHGAFSWLAVTHIADTEAAAWLTAMARDAVVQRRGLGMRSDPPDPTGSGSSAGPDPTGSGGTAHGDVTGSGGSVAGTLAAVARLSDPKREVVVLRLLCGHSLDHTAHLSGFTRRAVLELQLSACLAIWELTSGSTAPAPRDPAAEEFEHHLTQRDPIPAPHAPASPAAHPALAGALEGALAVASSLREAAPGYLTGPDPALVERLRQDLLTGKPTTGKPRPGAPLTREPLTPDPPTGAPHAPEPLTGAPLAPEPLTGAALTGDPGELGARRNLARRSRGPRTWRVAGPESWWGRLSTGLAESRLLRRPWLATGVATAGIVVVLTLQAFGDPAPPGACDGRPCPATTVASVAAAESSSLGTPRTTALRPSTTTSTVAAPAAPPSAPRTSAVTTPPSTRPATTAPPTTAPRPTTTTPAPTPPT